MIVSLEEVKHHLRIEEEITEDDAYIQILILAAEEFIKNGTGKTFDSSNNLAKVTMFFLVTDMYENRNMTTEKLGEKTRSLTSMILTQLSYTDGVEK